MRNAPCFVALLLCFLPERCRLLAGDLYPLVLVPGLGGNQLEARLTAAYEPSVPICGDRKGAGWFRIWFDESMIVDPQAQRCFAEQMSLFYDPDTDDFRSTRGVQIRAPCFGSTQAFCYKDPDNRNTSSYMALLVEHLEGIGYTEGEDLFGAPYDFRHGPAPRDHSSQVSSQFLRDLKDLVQNASESNGGKPVILLTHSMGGLLALQLLHRSTPEWRTEFIKHFIPLSAPWGGAVAEMLNFASGSDFGLPFVDRLLLRQESRSWESSMWLLPSPKAFGDAPLVVSKQGNYSAVTMSEFIAGVGFSEGVGHYEGRILPLIQESEAPSVPVTCITGTGVKTVEVLVYGEGGFDEFPEFVHGDGDGTVNLASLLAIESEWSKLPGQEFRMIKLPNISHEDIVKNDSALRVILREVESINHGELRSIS